MGVHTRMQSVKTRRRDRQLSLLLSCGVIGAATLGSCGAAFAQIGIGAEANTEWTGTIGTNKNVSQTIVRCPTGSVAAGSTHGDRSMDAPRTSIKGMSDNFGIYCANIIPSGSGFNVAYLTTAAPTVKTNYNWLWALAPLEEKCPSGQIIGNMGGWEREWSGGQYPPWASALRMYCYPLIKNSSDWASIGTDLPTPVTVGRVEEPPAGYQPNYTVGPFCPRDGRTILTGMRAQTGGEGIDGINLYCGTLQQARFGSILTFSNFNWTQTRGGSGWTTDLRQGTTLLSVTGMSGQAKTPYSSSGANDTSRYDAASEVYVLPASNYRAVLNGRPSGISAESYLVTGNCLTGISLSNEQDGACTLNIEGRPDLAAAVTSPSQTYYAYNQPQNFVFGMNNVGPRNVTSSNGYRVTATLPAGWQVSGSLPSGCTSSGQVISCPVTDVSASSSPGNVGQRVSYTIAVIATAGVQSGVTSQVPVRLDRSVPDGTGNQAIIDYNTSNDVINGSLRLELGAELGLRKVWANATVGDTATLRAQSGTGALSPFTATATGPNTNHPGPLTAVPVGSVYVLTETLGASNTGSYNASNWSCTGGGSLVGNQLTINAAASGQTIVCSITNTRRESDVRVTKSALPTTVLSGDTVVWTFSAFNDGPADADGTIIKDTPGAGLDCTVPPPPTCTASGGATCPATYSAAALANGVVVPRFPNGGSLVFTMRCRVTATGL